MDAALQQQAAIASHSPRFPFLKLPLELQYKICYLFCRHCRGASTPFALSEESAGTPFATLKALSETCRALQNIAQPILYHYPDVKTYTPFFKTVTARPDLAASVKVLARIYESDWLWYKRQPKRHSKEDISYLIQLGQQFRLHEGNAQDDRDYKLDMNHNDDANFKRCFEWLGVGSEDDDVGYTKGMVSMVYHKLLTALYLCILPRIQFLLIDLCDGKSYIRYSTLNSGRLLYRYPYLNKAIAARPDHFTHLDTVIFRDSFHDREDRIGLEAVDLLAAIPNVRVAFFDFVGGEKPDDFREIDPLPAAVELSWPALPRLEELYFDPCVRRQGAVPLVAISNMLQRILSLKKFVYRHKFPDVYKPEVLFSPRKLLDVILLAKETLLHLHVFCNSAKIPSLPGDMLFDHRLKELTLLKTLVLDEELFCQHWVSESCKDSCLISILPDNLAQLTIRLHDKFKAVPDVVRLGREVASGQYSRLSRLSLHVLHDMKDLTSRYEYSSNSDKDAFDSDYFLHGIPAEKWEETLRELADSIRPTVSEAFQSTHVFVDVRYVHERLFSTTRNPYR